MSGPTFEGRVAVVTGAGRGIGRSYAALLAERGARVVVNDLGTSIKGDGSDGDPATTVAEELTAAGAEAMADTSDVSSAAGAHHLIERTIERFGRIDVLINNAGIIRWAGFPEADEDNLARHLAVHVTGSFGTARAAWPHMVDQGYGRIVMTTSGGMFGLPLNLSYATAKAAVVGLTRSLATAGAAHGILVNSIAPAAMTRMAGRRPVTDPTSGSPDDPMSPDLVAPMVGFLASEACPVTGEIYAAGAGRFARVFIACAEGYVHPTGDPTIEDIARHWATINDERIYSIPTDLTSWSGAFMAHLADGTEAP